MQALPYTTRKGARQFRPRVSLAELDQDRGGFCVACGVEAEIVESDARMLRCDACGAHKVYGLEQLAIMRLLILAEDDQ